MGLLIRIPNPRCKLQGWSEHCTVYAVDLASALQSWRWPRRRTRVLHELTRVLHICSVQFKVTPTCRYFPLLADSSVCSYRRYLLFMGFCFLETGVTVHFWRWNSVAILVSISLVTSNLAGVARHLIWSWLFDFNFAIEQAVISE